MSKLVIVSIPEEDDHVWRISSEKVPHMTLLFLGDALLNPNVTQIQEFLDHAASTSLSPFGLSVDRRGKLGDDEADVLFFRSNSWDFPNIKHFRDSLLQNTNIRKAYDSVEQFPEWNPHITLGYPETPANPDNRDYPKLYEVYFDRVALWFGDYEGPEFRLTNPENMEVSMSSAVDGILAHYGKKGMKWGQRSTKAPTDVTVTLKGAKIKTKGGKNQPASSDAIGAKVVNQKLKKSGTNALSNKDLETLATRLNLEQRVSTLKSNQTTVGNEFVKAILGEKPPKSR